MNYWMKLEHLGRYIWASKICKNEEAQVVADIACATGYGSVLLSDGVNTVVGFDRSSKYIEMAKFKENVSYVCEDLDFMDVSEYSEKFDVVVSFETLEHVKNPKGLIKKFSIMIKEGGLLLLSFPNELFEKLDENGNNKDIYHLHIFELDEVKHWIESSGFVILEVLGQSYCNEMCQEENESIKKEMITARELEQKHSKSISDIFSDAHKCAIPNAENIKNSYSFIIKCKKV